MRTESIQAGGWIAAHCYLPGFNQVVKIGHKARGCPSIVHIEAEEASLSQCGNWLVWGFGADGKRAIIRECNLYLITHWRAI